MVPWKRTGSWGITATAERRSASPISLMFTWNPQCSRFNGSKSLILNYIVNHNWSRVEFDHPEQRWDQGGLASPCSSHNTHLRGGGCCLVGGWVRGSPWCHPQSAHWCPAGQGGGRDGSESWPRTSGFHLGLWQLVNGLWNLCKKHIFNATL